MRASVSHSTRRPCNVKDGTRILPDPANVWEFINKKIIQEKPIVIVGDFWSKVVEILNNELLRDGLEVCTKFAQKVRTPRKCAVFLARRILHSRDRAETLSFDYFFEEVDHFLR